jgi:hypothetical protein
MEIGKAVKARNHAPLSFSNSIFFFAPYVRDISTRHYVVGDCDAWVIQCEAGE